MERPSSSARALLTANCAGHHGGKSGTAQRMRWAPIDIGEVTLRHRPRPSDKHRITSDQISQRSLSAHYQITVCS